MEKISHDLSEIAYSLQYLAGQLAVGAHMKRRPTWDEVANHIAHRRFPENGLQLRPALISLAVRRLIMDFDPALINQRDISLRLPGRPDLYIGVHRSYGLPPERTTPISRPSYLNDGSILRESYHLLFIDPSDLKAHPNVFRDYGEGIILNGSPSKLHPYLQIQEHKIPGGPTTLKDYPGDTIPANVEDHRKSVAMRILRRIGL